MTDLEARYVSLRQSAACVRLSQTQVAELLNICGQLVEERQRIRLVLGRLAPEFGEVRALLNELSRTVR